MKKVICVIVLVGPAALVLVTHHFMTLASIASNYYAKEICSCVFVIGQSKQYCYKAWQDKKAKNYSLNIDNDKKVVSTKFFGFSAQAQWTSLHEGCRLLN